MSVLKTLWGGLFRLFPCPTAVGLRPVGNPARDSPVLVTCNFDLTVKRLTRILVCARVDAWLLVADSGGVNVWCAAGGDELNTGSVVSVVKTSDVAHRVDHRRLILPPLAAPGVDAKAVEEATGWAADWGPVRGADLPAYLAAGRRRTPAMKRVTWTWWERMDPALGTYFAALPLGALGFALFGPTLLVSFLAIATLSFLLFFTIAPWIPGRTGGGKTLFALAAGGLAFAAAELWHAWGGPSLRAKGIITLVCVALYGLDLGGLAPHLRSGFDPFLARLGIGALGSTTFAGTPRTDLLLGRRTLTLDPDACTRCRACQEVCPLGVWDHHRDGHAHLAHGDRCTACTACLTQCPAGAITAPTRDPA